jgi:hypothetical protein
MKTFQELLKEEEEKALQLLKTRKTFKQILEEQLAEVFQKEFPDATIDSSKIKVTASKR